MRFRDRTHGRAAPGRTAERIRGVADVDLDRLEIEPERLSQHESADGPRAGAKILRPAIRLDSAIGMDSKLARRRVRHASPLMNGHPETLDDRAVTGAFPVRVPHSFPVHQFGRDPHLIGIELGRLAGRNMLQVLQEDVVTVDTHPGGQVVVGRLRHRAALRMVRRSPGPLRAEIGRDRRRRAAVVGGLEHVRNHGRRNASAAIAARSPVMRVPYRDEPVGVRPEAYLDVPGWPVPGDLEFLVAGEHPFDGSARFLGELRRRDPPVVGSELAAETTADVFAMHVDIVGCQLEGLGKPVVGSRNVLR